MLPSWEAVWPQDDMPRRLIQAADEVLKGRADPEQIGHMLTLARDELDDLSGDTRHETHAAYFAGFSAYRCLETAVFDIEFELVRFDLNSREDDLDPYSSDAARDAWFGSVTPGYNLPVDPAKSLEFWTWWLDEAVPEAWRSVPQ